MRFLITAWIIYNFPSETMTEGNRRYKRFSVDVMNIKGKMTVSTRVDVLDINEEKVTLKADLRLNINTEYVLHLQTDEMSLKLKGLVEWSSISEPVRGLDDEIIPMYRAEMKFYPVTGDARSDLSSFIEVFNLSEEERLGGLGLQINRQENVLIDQSQEYRVKKISLGGLLIGGAGIFEVDRVFPMELTLPENRLIGFTGRITSCSPGSNSQLSYDIGVAFSEMSEQHKETLKEFLGKLDAVKDDVVDYWAHHKRL